MTPPTNRPTVLSVCGARPNFMKIAPVIRALEATGRFETPLVHTGQHYDHRMSKLFFSDLNIPKPDIDLEVGSGSHAVQTAEIMRRFEPVCLERRPDWILVVGDVNSTIACALVAAKLGIRIAHVEAGLRSFDRSMPEEINRVLTDTISDLLFVTEPSGVENLRNEGIGEERIRFVGNVMIDTLLASRDQAEASAVLDNLGLTEASYVLVTLHRPANVDDPRRFGAILDALIDIAADRPVVFPIHPRTRKNLDALPDRARIGRCDGLRLIEPQGYLDFLKLMSHALAVLTDSGGMQEETTILDVPCLTLRENTERPVTISHGTNRLVYPGRAEIIEAFAQCHQAPRARREQPPLWDGRAAERIASEMEAFADGGDKVHYCVAGSR